ncbi:MAG: GNAT family N-acetyltransferase [Pseudomonadota bacterium]
MRLPCLSTRRLLLRPFEPSDATAVQRLAGDARVADTTKNIPHPYPDGAAEAWISSHRMLIQEGKQVVFAITDRSTTELCGAISLRLSDEKEIAELGYWTGVPFWGQGIATEATEAVCGYGFAALKLYWIVGWHLVRNPASGRVMQKAGMTADAGVSKTLLKNGKQERLVSCSISSEHWMSLQRSSAL